MTLDKQVLSPEGCTLVSYGVSCRKFDYRKKNNNT